MLVIRRNQNNKMVVSVSSHKTLSNPNYLFSFQHILSKEKVQFFPKNISNSTDRYDEFEFNEGVEPAGYTGDVPYKIFPYPGQYYYSVYETFNTGSTNPAYAFDKLEEGRAFIEDDSVPDPYEYTYVSSNENNSNYIYYTPGTNEQRILVSMYMDTQNSSAAYYTWKYSYPNVKVKDLETGVIETMDSYLTGETSCGDYNRAIADVFFKEITTGSTWPGFKVYMDETEVISKGYNFKQPTPAQDAFSGITYYNFRPGFIPPLWSVDYIQHNTDGTTESGTTAWSVDVDNPRNLFVATISGNSSANYSYSQSQYTGTTFEEACNNYYAGTGDIRRLYYTYSSSAEYWWNDTGTTSTYSLTECEQTISDTNFFIAQNSTYGVSVASASTEGNVVYYDTCIPPTPTPTPTASITPTPTLTPNPACPQQIVISDTTNGSVIPNGSYNELTFAGTEYGYFSGGSFFTGTAPDGNNYKVFGIQPSSTYYTYCWDAGSGNWGVGRSNYAYLGQGGTYTGGAWLGASTSVVFGSEYLPGTGSKGLFTTYYLSYPVLCPTPSITPTNTSTPTITPTNTITPTQSATPTPTPTITPSPSPVMYNILAENSDDLLTEGGDNLIKEQLT